MQGLIEQLEEKAAQDEAGDIAEYFAYHIIDTIETSFDINEQKSVACEVLESGSFPRGTEGIVRKYFDLTWSR